MFRRGNIYCRCNNIYLLDKQAVQLICPVDEFLIAWSDHCLEMIRLDIMKASHTIRGHALLKLFFKNSNISSHWWIRINMRKWEIFVWIKCRIQVSRHSDVFIHKRHICNFGNCIIEAYDDNDKNNDNDNDDHDDDDDNDDDDNYNDNDNRIRAY